MFYGVKDVMLERKRIDCQSSKVQNDKDLFGNLLLRVKYLYLKSIEGFFYILNYNLVI